MRIPRAWTDADGAPAGPPPVTPSAALTADAIRDLVELIDALRGRR